MLQNDIFLNLPTIFMGGFAVISSLIVLILPETLNIKLPDTIQESVDVGDTKLVLNKPN